MKLLVALIVAAQTVIGSDPDEFVFAFCNGIDRGADVLHAELSHAQFLDAAPVGRKPDIAFPVLDYFLDIVIRQSVCFRIDGECSVAVQDKSLFGRKPETAVLIKINMIYRCRIHRRVRRYPLYLILIDAHDTLLAQPEPECSRTALPHGSGKIIAESVERFITLE